VKEEEADDTYAEHVHGLAAVATKESIREIESFIYSAYVGGLLVVFVFLLVCD